MELIKYLFEYSSKVASKPTRDWRTSRLISGLIPAKNRTPASIQVAAKPSATLVIEQSIKTERTPARYYLLLLNCQKEDNLKKDSKDRYKR